MNWLGLLLVALLSPVVICGLWMAAILIADAFKPDPPGLCMCGRHVIADNSHLHDRDDEYVHSRVLCQPFREWVEP